MISKCRTMTALGTNTRVFVMLKMIAALVLFVSGLPKIISATSEHAYLDRPDAVLSFLTVRSSFLVVGNLEILTALYVIAFYESRWSVYLIQSLTATFLIYRLGRLLLSEGGPCPCLGNAGMWFNMTVRQIDAISTAFLIVLVAISILLGFENAHENRANAHINGAIK